MVHRMNLLFRRRSEQVLDSLLGLLHKRELEALQLQASSEIQWLRRDRQRLRRQIAVLKEEQRLTEWRMERAAELTEQMLSELSVEETEEPDDDFVTV